MFTLPTRRWGRRWLKALDTAAGWPDTRELFAARATVEVQARSLILLQRAAPPSR